MCVAAKQLGFAPFSRNPNAHTMPTSPPQAHRHTMATQAYKKVPFSPNHGCSPIWGQNGICTNYRQMGVRHDLGLRRHFDPLGFADEVDTLRPSKMLFEQETSKAVGGWWSAVGGWWRLAGWCLAVGGGWRLAVGGPRGLSLSHIWGQSAI